MKEETKLNMNEEKSSKKHAKGNPKIKPGAERSEANLWEHRKDQYKVYDATNEIKLPIFLPELQNIS